MGKAEVIKQTLKQTRERRKHQIARTYELKLQNLSRQDLEKLSRLFLEAKWFYNWVIADLSKLEDENLYKTRLVEVKTPSGFEAREIKALSSQMKQSLVTRIKESLSSLVALKAKGHKVGKLRFKRHIRCIPLKQYGNTFSIDFERNRIHVQGFGRRWFRVLGLHQIPRDAEISHAQLIRKPSGYYLHVVCYLDREKAKLELSSRQVPLAVGVDLGIETQITCSDGTKISWEFPETRRLKKLQRELARKKKGSRRYRKALEKLRKEYEYLTNCRRDAQSKAIAYLKKFALIAVQVDSVKGWHRGLFGRKVQHTGVGAVLSRLRSLGTLVPVVLVDRYQPTSRRCCRCGFVRDELELSDRVFECPKCGLVLDRDVNAAVNIAMLGLSVSALAGRIKPALPVDCGEVTPVEWTASADAGMVPASVSRHGEAGSPHF